MDVAQPVNPFTVLNNKSLRIHMFTFTDAIGQIHEFAESPKRIVSLVPSTTETLYAVGVGDRIVGVTRYCVHPSSAMQDTTIVGGTKECNYDRIASLKPDVVFCNQEENTPDMVTTIQGMGIPVVVAFPKNHRDALNDIKDIALLFDQQDKYTDWEDHFTKSIDSVSPKPFSYLYLIWRKPWMVAGTNTFIHQQLALIGGQNLHENTLERYITIEMTDLQDFNGHILLSSEPYPFLEKHKEELTELGIPSERIHFINGEYCSWHGVRMLDSIQYLQRWKNNCLT
jgi:iron complex transport system substrate-binding protein